MKILVINGPNLNMLGIREPNIYGNSTYKNLEKQIKNYSKQKKFKVKIFQSNCEGEIVSQIQKAYFKKFDGIVINPAGYTHTSVSILDALKSSNIKTVEVHISNVDEREDFRKVSFVSLYAQKVIKGQGLKGYLMAIDYLLQNS